MKSDDFATVYEFGPFRLEVARLRLLRGDEVVQLRPKAVETLLFLLEQRTRVVEKEELLAHLWPKTIVEEANLTQYIYLLRKTLGENNGTGDYILTVPGRGYRFIAEVQEVTCRNGHAKPDVLPENSLLTAPSEKITAVEANTAAGTQGQATFGTRTDRARYRKAAGWVGVVLLAVSALAGWWHFLPSKPGQVSTESSAPTMTKLFTLRDNNGATAISPDGRLVSYLQDHSLWVKELANGKETRVVPSNRELQIFGYNFSPDSRMVYYVKEDFNHRGAGVLYRVSSGGGMSERLLTGVTGAFVAFSPDGQRMLFRRNDFWTQKTNTIMLANADGSNEEVFAVSESFRDFLYLTWSPDGRKVAYVNWRVEGEKESWEVIERSLATREQQTILLKRSAAIRHLAFLPAGRGFLFLGNDPTSEARAIWWQPPNAPARRITQDANQYLGLSLTSDGNSLVTAAGDRPGRIYVANLNDPTHPQPVTATEAYYDVLAWRPLKHLVYSLFNGTGFNLWQSLADGSTTQRLMTQAGRYNYPAVSPDGQRLVFTAWQEGKARLMLREPNGNLRSLLELECVYPSFSPDGSTVYFQFHPQGGAAEIWRLALSGGEPEKVTAGNFPVVSPDGRRLAFWYDDGPSQRSLLAVKALDGKTPTQFFDVQGGYPALRWLSDGSGVAFLTHDEIRLQPIAGGAARTLLKVQGDVLFSFDFSPDGQQVAYIAGRVTSNVLLLSDLLASTKP